MNVFEREGDDRLSIARSRIGLGLISMLDALEATVCVGRTSVSLAAYYASDAGSIRMDMDHALDVMGPLGYCHAGGSLLDV